MIKINSEQDLLNAETRKKLIESFNEGKNAERKHQAYKAYECLKDKTDVYVLRDLLMQFENDTVYEMQYSITNISILRKVIDKLAKVYNNGVKRTMPTDTETTMIEDMAKELKLNETMKKANCYFRTFKNALIYVRPIARDNGLEIAVEVKAPFSYDVVEDPRDPTRALAVILSDYIPEPDPSLSVPLRGGTDDPGVIQPKLVQSYNPGRASTLGHDDPREFIWWTKNYHFTTNAKGDVIAFGDNNDFKNPLTQLPFVNLAEDRDGCFWAEGGRDLIDSGVKINTMITNVKHVGVSQGYGQMYMTGKNLPKSVKVGPTHCVQLEQNEGEPTPAIGYLNSNPPLADLKSLVEMETALMLTTNNLSTSGFATSLGNSKDFASGIALMIDKSESVEDVNEQAQKFIDEEPKAWELIGLWYGALKAAGVLVEEQAKLPMPKEPGQVLLAFPVVKIPTTESEELDIIERRREIGLNTEVELLMRDDPSLTVEDAQAKLNKIKEEKKANMESAALNGALSGDQDQKGDGVAGQNGKQDSTSGDNGSPDESADPSQE